MDRWIFEVLLDDVWIGVSLAVPTPTVDELIAMLPESFREGIHYTNGEYIPGRMRNVNTNETIPWEVIR